MTDNGHIQHLERFARAEVTADFCVQALREIAAKDPVEMALDPEWPQRHARHVLSVVDSMDPRQ